MPRQLAVAVIAVSSALFVTSCSTTLQGNAVSVFDDPFSVAGMPATDGPSGLRSSAPQPTRDVEGTDDGAVDQLARQAISDIEEYWQRAYSESFGGEFRPVRELISWDADGFDDTEFCGDSTFGVINAGYCFPDKNIGWDRGEFLPALAEEFGDVSALDVFGHEYGHAIQDQAGLVDDDTPVLVSEQQADCFEGAYLRWVAEGNSSRFTVSTGDGLNNVLAAVIASRDPVLSEDDPMVGYDEHGSAFERVSAFQLGFTDGAAACASIDMREIEQRRGDLPVLLPEDHTGELAITEKSVQDVIAAMNTVFSPKNPPELSLEPADCPDARPSPPVSFCPATNTIAVDLPALAEMGSPGEVDEEVTHAKGDNTAYSVLVSRYMQAIQHEHGGVTLDNAQAALRTACLTGVATAELSKDSSTAGGNTITLTAGDVDEAVSGILTNGLAASDVNGESVPSGFSRIDAFRVGVLGDQERCFKRFD